MEKLLTSTAKFTNVTATSLRVTSSLTATATGLEISSAEVTGTLTNAMDVTSMDLSGTLTAATVDLNAGNIDGVAIGDASQSTAKFTNVTASSLRVTSSLTATATGLEISSAEVTGTLTANAMDVTSMDLSGTLTAATVDLNAGNIDGVAIGDVLSRQLQLNASLQMLQRLVVESHFFTDSYSNRT